MARQHSQLVLFFYGLVNIMILVDSTSMAFQPHSVVGARLTTTRVLRRSATRMNPTRQTNSKTTARHAVPPELLLMDHGDTLPTTMAASASPSFSTLLPTQLMAEGSHVHHHHQHISDGTLLDTILSNPAFWSLSVMVTLVALLYLWEEATEQIRHKLSQTLFLPVFEKMWGEIAGLGFIGLVLQIVVHPFQPLLGQWSEEYLGEEDILLESFEFLHAAFFQVGIGFFAAAAYMVAIALGNIIQIKTLSGIGVVEDNVNGGTCLATSDSLANFLGAPIVPASAPKNGDNVNDDAQLLSQLPRTTVQEEFQVTSEERCAQALLIRSYMIEKGVLSQAGRVEPLMEQRFASHLYELVEISPLTWLPLIPALALANGVDLSHDVVNAQSPNALDAAGFFYSSPQVIFPSLAIVGLSVVWSFVNFWKLSEIKSMVLPTMIKEQIQQPSVKTEIVDEMSTTQEMTVARMLPPRFTIPEQLQAYQSAISTTFPVLNAIERVFAEKEDGEDSDSKENGNDLEEALFGVPGGLELYLSSLRSQSWLCITSIVFFGTQIVPRDIQVLLSPNAVAGDPASVLPEFLTYSTLIAISLALLAVSPTVFLNYSLCSCVLEKEKEHIEMKKADANGAAAAVATGEENAVPVNGDTPAFSQVDLDELQRKLEEPGGSLVNENRE